mmetsp:Transcript_18071/g.41814  ORF Transcript_18071/g.41814 Transcript_18071/m.41814 type:complete len:236 (-) Transcript_18071:47-754(-)
MASLLLLGFFLFCFCAFFFFFGLDCILIQCLYVLGLIGWDAPIFTPICFGDLFLHHVQTDQIEILLQRSSVSQSISWVEVTQERLGREHVPRAFGISQYIFDALHDEHVDGWSHIEKVPIIGFPVLWFLPTYITMTDNALCGREQVVTVRVKTSRQDNLLSHKDPWQKGIHGNLFQEGRMGHHETRCHEGCKTGYIQLDRIIRSGSFQSYDLCFGGMSGKDRSAESRGGTVYCLR